MFKYLHDKGRSSVIFRNLTGQTVCLVNNILEVKFANIANGGNYNFNFEEVS